MFHGSMVALLTPFRGGQVDDAALRKLIEFQIANGTNGIVPCGTTGENPTLSQEEYRHVTYDLTLNFAQHVAKLMERGHGELAGE